MRSKIADYLLDISKLVFAGVVLSVILQMEGASKLAILLTGICATVLLALIGFTLMRDE